MKRCAIDLARIDAEAKGRKAVSIELYQALNNEIRHGNSVADPAAMFERGVQTAAKQARHPQVCKVQEVLEVQSFIDRFKAKEGDDDEVQVDIGSVAQHVTKCPLTGKPLERPVKNICGHVYSLEGVIQYLMQHNRASRADMPTELQEVPPQYSAPCAYTGCSTSIRAGTLKRDYATELSQRQMRTASQRRISMEVDNVDLV
eukprot:GFKZ01009321.1.p1 GENE.GFKZ01009321.1~~GFKZ01009321.1.p1  ORF type:complete len:202 (+),score=26.63 GFKZ01009321.1:543-1148(+)